MPAHYAQAVDGRRRFQRNGQLTGDQTRALRAVPQQGEPPPVFLPPRHKAGNLQNTPAIHAKGNALTWLDLFALQFAAHGVQRFCAAQCREACAQSRKDAGTLLQNLLKIRTLGAGHRGNDDAAFFYQRIAAVCAVGQAADIRRGIGPVIREFQPKEASIRCKAEKSLDCFKSEAHRQSKLLLHGILIQRVQHSASPFNTSGLSYGGTSITPCFITA